MWLRQSTTVNIKLGPAVAQTDAVTEKTALTPTVNLTKGGGTIAARNSATAIAHDANGWYTVELNATDTGTLGRLQVYFRDPTNQLPVWESYMVLPAVVYDAMVAGTDNLDVSVVQWLGTAAATPATAGVPKVAIEAAGDFAQAAADKVWSSTVRTLSAFSTALAVSVWDVLASGVATVSSIGLQIKTNLDAAITSRSSHTAAQAGTDAASKVLTTPAQTLATDISGRVLLQPTQTGVTIPTVTAVTNDVGVTQVGADKVWATTTRALTDKIGFALSAAGVQALWDALTSALTAVGSIGKLLVDNVNATISSRLPTASYTAPLDAAATRTAVGLAAANLDTQLAAKALDSTVAKDATVAKDSTVAKAATVATAAALVTAQADLDDIQTRLPAALVGGRMDSNASAINNSNAAAIRLALSAAQIIPGTVDSAGFAPTTTQFEASDITTAAASHYAGRVIIFTSGTLIGQAVAISAYSLVTGRGRFTVSALTAAPGTGVTFIVV